MTQISNCQLEIDENRGVLYVHSPKGITLLRVCQIPLSQRTTIHYDKRYRTWLGIIDIAARAL